MNPFGEEPPPPPQPNAWQRYQQKMSINSILEWSRECIAANAIRRPAGPNGSAESDKLGTRVVSEHLRASYVEFCRLKGVRPLDVNTFGRECTLMFGRRRQLTPEKSNRRRPTAYDVPSAEMWQEYLDAKFGTQKAEETPGTLRMAAGWL